MSSHRHIANIGVMCDVFAVDFTKGLEEHTDVGPAHCAPQELEGEVVCVGVCRLHVSGETESARVVIIDVCLLIYQIFLNVFNAFKPNNKTTTTTAQN